MKKVGVLRFPGTNCDRDVFAAVEGLEGLKAEWLWYEDHFSPAEYEAFVLPGGFSYGDYLRSGALAAQAPAMEDIREANKKEKPILGICNGFQVLCEAGLLPGALLKNQRQKFVDCWVELSSINKNPYWATSIETAKIPVAHGEGRFFIDSKGLKKLKDKGLIWWQYLENPNGSIENIAGIMNQNKNVAALMPHPERAMWKWMGSTDGKPFFEQLLRI